MHEELRHAVLSYTRNPAYRAVKPRVIAERLGLLGEAAEELKKTIKKMVRAGDVEFGPNHLVVPTDAAHPAREALGMGRPARAHASPAAEAAAVTIDDDAGAEELANPAPDEDPEAGADAEPATPPPMRRASGGNHVVGTFRRVASGDGFVRPEGTPAASGKDDDVYINVRNTGDAASGDTVRIAVRSGAGPRGKAEGKVVDVVSRATNQFVGTYFEAEGLGLVRVDGKVFGDPVYVGDPGAKGAKEGDKVVLEMVRFPSQVRDGEGVITRLLGERGQPGVDTLSIKYEFGLPGDFADDTLAEARRQAEAFDESIPEGRRDLTPDVVITIDPATARDFDDAISLRRLERGHWELGVHIADVSHFVQPKTPLDREAYDRATSVYLPDEVVPMLPEVISNNLASLQPDKVRYAMTAVIEFTASGAPVGADVFKSAIKSRRRFTYEEVDQYLSAKGLVKARPAKKDDPAQQPGAALAGLALAPEVDALLADMFDLAMMLRKRRMERGSLELSMPEVKVDLDNDGRVCGAHVEQNTESHQIIEEFMLAANEAVARRLAEAGLLFLRRVHGNPDPRKSKALTEFIRSLGLPADNLQDRFEVQELLARVKGDPREHAVNFAALRSMQKAVYSPAEEGHYALASDCYCHFTSPIRRYPDLTVHRLLEGLNTGRKPRQEPAVLLEQGDHCSEREQRAATAERELTKVKLLNYLSDKIGTEIEGVITGVESFGLFIMGKDLPAEGFVHITALGDDYFKFDRASHSINGYRGGNSFRLGDAVRVAVAAVDVDARQLDFRYLGRVGPTPKRPTAAKMADRKPAAGKKGPPRGRPKGGGGKRR
ncbi:MAG: ribonuclease R [Lacipirellulaceae bacterium]